MSIRLQLSSCAGDQTWSRKATCHKPSAYACPHLSLCGTDATLFHFPPGLQCSHACVRGDSCCVLYRTGALLCVWPSPRGTGVRVQKSLWASLKRASHLWLSIHNFIFLSRNLFWFCLGGWFGWLGVRPAQPCPPLWLPPPPPPFVCFFNRRSPKQGKSPTIHVACRPGPVLAAAQGGPWGTRFFFVWDRPRDRQPPIATNHQPPTATNHQPPIATNHQPPTTSRQAPTANCQPPPTTVEHMSYTRSLYKTAVQEHFFPPS